MAKPTASVKNSIVSVLRLEENYIKVFATGKHNVAFFFVSLNSYNNIKFNSFTTLTQIENRKSCMSERE